MPLVLVKGGAVQDEFGGVLGIRGGGVVEVGQVAGDFLGGEVVPVDPVQELGQDGGSGRRPDAG